MGSLSRTAAVQDGAGTNTHPGDQGTVDQCVQYFRNIEHNFTPEEKDRIGRETECAEHRRVLMIAVSGTDCLYYDIPIRGLGGACNLLRCRQQWQMERRFAGVLQDTVLISRLFVATEHLSLGSFNFRIHSRFDYISGALGTTTWL